MQLHHRNLELRQHSIRVILISFNGERRARRWLELTGVGFPLLLDPDRLVYKAYETERSLFRSWNPRTVWETIRLIRAGRRWLGLQGDTAQLGGDFLIDPSGTIRWAHYSLDPVDRPELGMILQAANRS